LWSNFQQLFYFLYFTHERSEFLSFCQSKHPDTTNLFCKIDFLGLYLTIDISLKLKAESLKHNTNYIMHQTSSIKHLTFSISSMEKSNPLIQIKNLSRGYRDNPKPLFDKLSLSLEVNDFFVLTGKSGAGKTTLVKFLTGKLTPPEKTIFYNNQDMSEFTGDDIQILRKRLGIIYQDYQLLEDLTVRDNIVYPLHLYELGETVIDSKLRQVIQKVNIKHLLETPVKLLSSGEKQRVSLARALIHDSEFIIADEPTGNLDWENTQVVADILIQANKSGNTIFLITHDIHLLNYLKAKHPIKLHVIK